MLILSHLLVWWKLSSHDMFLVKAARASCSACHAIAIWCWMSSALKLFHQKDTPAKGGLLQPYLVQLGVFCVFHM